MIIDQSLWLISAFLERGDPTVKLWHNMLHPWVTILWCLCLCMCMCRLLWLCGWLFWGLWETCLSPNIKSASVTAVRRSQLWPRSTKLWARGPTRGISRPCKEPMRCSCGHGNWGTNQTIIILEILSIRNVFSTRTPHLVSLKSSTVPVYICLSHLV